MELVALPIPEAFALGGFLARWGSRARFDLSGSESATIKLPDLLAMADTDDRARWQELNLGYGDPRGASWLRAAIAGGHQGLSADNILCCAGAQEGLACVMQTLLAAGDHAVVILPIYQPSERAVTTICAATGVPLEEHGHWHLDIARVAAAIRPETRLVLLNFPNSPTGATIDLPTLNALIDLCRHHGLWLVNDEVYRLMAYDTQAAPPPVADLYERGISINALSKSFGLPGLRVGWIACQDQHILAQMLLVKSGLSSYLAAPAEILAHIALQAQPAIIGRNRSVAMSNLQQLQHFISRHPNLFQDQPPGQLAFAAPRYIGADGAEYFTASLVHATGVLILPSSLWRSRLGAVPTDRMRIHLGGADIQPALAALDSYLTDLPNPDEDPNGSGRNRPINTDTVPIHAG